jgi:hypothetical protein
MKREVEMLRPRLVAERNCASPVDYFRTNSRMRVKRTRCWDGQHFGTVDGAHSPMFRFSKMTRMQRERRCCHEPRFISALAAFRPGTGGSSRKGVDNLVRSAAAPGVGVPEEQEEEMKK